jgi:hypothetical protein
MFTATERYVALLTQIRKLNAVADTRNYGEEDRESARREREPLTHEAAELFALMMEEHADSFVSEPLHFDRGLVLLVEAVLVKLRHEIDRELERNDLTPYMWSTLRGKSMALSKVFRMLDGRPLKKITDWVVPQYLLIAEYDDESVDFEEAADEEEANEVLDGYVGSGAIVHRYAVYPETGTMLTLFHPVLPHENIHKTMTQRAYDWTVRAKGAENLMLPADPSAFITHRYGSEDEELA